MHIKIETGKDIIDNNIKEFNVINGAWHGIVTCENGKYTMHAGNKNQFTKKFNEVNSWEFDENYILDLNITDIEFALKGKELVDKLNAFDLLYQNGEDFDKSFNRSFLTDDDIGNRETFKALADLNKSFAEIVEMFPNTGDKIDLLNLQKDIIEQIASEHDIELEY